MGRFPRAALRHAIAGAATLLVAPTAAAAQQDTTRTGSIVGLVTDTAGVPVQEALVTLGAADGFAPRTTYTTRRGMFAFTGVPAVRPYTIEVRRFGFTPERIEGLALLVNDTLRLTIQLQPTLTMLPELAVRARRGSPQTWRHITDQDFDARKFPNALMVLARLRPNMFGDESRCDPRYAPFRLIVDQSRPDEIAAVGGRPAGLPSIAGDPFVSAAMSFRASRGGGRYKFLRDMMDMTRDPPHTPLVAAVYVNGVRRDVVGKPTVWVLRNIPAEDIKEIRYADCWDRSVPIGMRYSLFVVTKPNKEEQEKIMKRLQPDSTRK